MHFGYFGLMGYRERGTAPRDVFKEHVEQVRHADRLGFEVAWFAEHHFSNYCICPSPSPSEPQERTNEPSSFTPAPCDC